MKVHLLDGTYELFRHHFGVPKGDRDPEDTVAATRGVLWSVLQLLEEGVTHLGVATDHVIESFRNDLWPGYKTSAGMPPELLEQIPMVEEALVAMGGAVTNLAAVKHELTRYDPEVVQGSVLDRDEIDRQIELYRSRDAAGRREIVGLQPQRADIILAGTCIVRTVLAKLGVESLTVSDRGLRHGVLLERFD